MPKLPPSISARALRSLADLLVALSLVATTATAVVAQTGRTTVVVGAGDAASGQFLRGVEVRIRSLDVARYTDSMGQARLERIPPGRFVVEGRRIGYAPLSAPILVRAEDSLEVVLLMNATAERLDPVVVSRNAVPMALREFESRRERGLGQFITGAQIDSAFGSTLSTVIESRIRGVTVVGDNANGMHLKSYRQSTEHALSLAAAPCWPTVYLDGVQLTDDDGRGPNLDIIALSSIGGIEFYPPSDVPVQYKASGVLRGASSPSCGVMLIWTRP